MSGEINIQEEYEQVKNEKEIIVKNKPKAENEVTFEVFIQVLSVLTFFLVVGILTYIPIIEQDMKTDHLWAFKNQKLIQDIQNLMKKTTNSTDTTLISLKQKIFELQKQTTELKYNEYFNCVNSQPAFVIGFEKLIDSLSLDHIIMIIIVFFFCLIVNSMINKINKCERFIDELKKQKE